MTARIIKLISNKEDPIVELAKKITIRVIKVGNLPLQGTKLFVNIAIKRSLFESMILAPTTPQALHPKPIHIVRDCFPWAHALENNLSILKAILGRYPESSNSVKRGKKILTFLNEKE